MFYYYYQFYSWVSYQYTTAVKIFEPNVSAGIVCDETLEHTTTAVKVWKH